MDSPPSPFPMLSYIIDNNGWVMFQYEDHAEASQAYIDYFVIWSEMYPDTPIDCQLTEPTKERPIQADNGMFYFPQFR